MPKPFAASGIAFVRAREVHSVEQVAAAADELRAPYVLKALDLLHKSDAGGVVVDLESREALLAAHGRLVARLGPPSFSVEEMADLADGVELIVGVDGIRASVHRAGRLGRHGHRGAPGRRVRARPGRRAEASRMLRRLRTAPLLDADRGRPAVDVAAAASAWRGSASSPPPIPRSPNSRSTRCWSPRPGRPHWTPESSRTSRRPRMDFDTPPRSWTSSARRRVRRAADAVRGRGRAGRWPAADGDRREADPRRDGPRRLRDQHADRVGRRGAVAARPGDRRGGVRQGHELPVGHPVAARERPRAAPSSGRSYLLPIIRGERFDAFAVTEPEAGSDPCDGDDRDPAPTAAGCSTARSGSSPAATSRTSCWCRRPVLARRRCRRCSWSRSPRPASRSAHTALHALRRQRAPGVHVHRRLRAGRGRARRGRPGLRPHQGVVHRRAADDRGAHRRRRRARADAGPGLGRRAQQFGAPIASSS